MTKYVLYIEGCGVNEQWEEECKTLEEAQEIAEMIRNDAVTCGAFEKEVSDD